MVEGFEELWADADGVDQWEGYCEDLAAVEDTVGGEFVEACSRGYRMKWTGVLLQCPDLYSTHACMTGVWSWV